MDKKRKYLEEFKKLRYTKIYTKRVIRAQELADDEAELFDFDVCGDDRDYLYDVPEKVG